MKQTVETLNLDPNDILIVTVGSLDHNILPTNKDLNVAKKYFQGLFGKNRKVLIVPSIYKLEVLKKTNN